jgi:hypothetical protein
MVLGMEMGLTTAETSSIASLNEAGSRRLPVRQKKVDVNYITIDRTKLTSVASNLGSI